MDLFGHRRGDVLVWFLLSLYCRRVYSNDLGIFIYTFLDVEGDQLTVVNLFFTLTNH